ncbi:50S ribosome-binding GTPase, partial [candidate division WOR-3 bacterium]|nr:50S ribosome-binding GTPase [candidate division WOR-3 bacterium]
VEYSLGFDEHEASGAIPHARICCVAVKLSRLVESAATSRFAIEGATVAIIGRPNAGKSSLFNRLVRSQRAITSPVAGTTRDRIDATAMLSGIPVRFVDTAGLTTRTGTRLSLLALAQTGKAVEQSDIIIALFDGSRPAGPSDRTVAATINGRRAICVLNKTDLVRRFVSTSLRTRRTGLIPVSCRTGAGIARLRTRLTRMLHAGPVPRLAVSRRQLEALSSCRDALVRANTAPTLETAALEITSAVDMLSQVDAPAPSTEILDRVFARFCVGK